ncbi:MAG: RloB family protein [Rhodospirillales bacterium]|nr:RloB family protein [Rhodospirillales bacterium]
MARDNSPKERQRRQLERKQVQRDSYDRILIVSEGSKTEPNYFGEIRTFYRLNTAKVQVRPSELGTAPIQVVQHAKDIFERGDPHRKILPRAFEQVYAVFDRDDHRSYFDALRLAESLDSKLKNDAKQFIRFKAIASVPSFELWLLLHYKNIQAPQQRNQVMQQLKSHIPSYNKGMDNVFETTRPHLDIATKRARDLAARFTAYNDSEPYTAIVELVNLLITLRG